ncbi:ATP-binding protein [Streptomyces sp. NPDC091376]|uniref:ATP-binding protein n=1 Tax=Streptomyces sp. NPDC091376 TaxID=3365994 RepID=UPI0038063D12
MAVKPGGRVAVLPGLRREVTDSNLDDVLHAHRAEVHRIGGYLRLGFVGILTVATVFDPIGASHISGAEAAVLTCYGILAIAASFLWRGISGCRLHTTLAVFVLCADITAVALLQIFSDGSPALALAVFLIPMFAAFQVPVRHTAMVAGLSVVAYCLLLAVDARLRVRTVDENAMVVLAFLVLTCVACLVVARQQQERAARITELTRERARLLAEVMTTEERERAALAEVLHDGPLQSVLAVRLQLRAAERSADPEVVRIARRRLLDISRQLRDLTAELHPVVLEANGIRQSLNTLVESTITRSGLRGECSITLARAQARDPRETLVFNAARELLNNVVTHAEATSFHVTLQERGRAWHLEVTDDGRGIAVDEARRKVGQGHIGLASLRIRVEAARGTMTITSTHSVTSVAIELPPYPAEI